MLHDLLEAPESLIPRTMLTDVFRQKGDSSIISNAIRINAGITTLDERPDFQVIHTKSAEESLEQVKSLMKKLYNPEEPFSTQILCPARKGISGVENMNIALQALLNPQTCLLYTSECFPVQPFRQVQKKLPLQQLVLV